MVITDKYTLFWEGVFSNFYPCNFEINGINFNTSEQYYMYQKAKIFGDEEVANLILEATPPLVQKHLGRKVHGYQEDIWSEVRYKHMYDACYAKFSQNGFLRSKLLKTVGTNLVEASPYDQIWGIGLQETDPLSWDENNWQGLNLLGKVLDEVRDAIINPPDVDCAFTELEQKIDNEKYLNGVYE